MPACLPAYSAVKGEGNAHLHICQTSATVCTVIQELQSQQPTGPAKLSQEELVTLLDTIDGLVKENDVVTANLRILSNSLQEAKSELQAANEYIAEFKRDGAAAPLVQVWPLAFHRRFYRRFTGVSAAQRACEKLYLRGRGLLEPP